MGHDGSPSTGEQEKDRSELDQRRDHDRAPRWSKEGKESDE